MSAQDQYVEKFHQFVTKFSVPDQLVNLSSFHIQFSTGFNRKRQNGYHIKTLERYLLSSN